MDLELQGRTALVTGASVGIGAGIVRALADEGVSVAAAARRADLVRSSIAAAQMRNGARVFAIEVDLTTVDGPTHAARQAENLLGQIDILINCAGGSRPADIGSGDALWDEAFALNFTSARKLASELVPGMQANRWGRIVNISGIIEPRKLGAATAAKGAMQVWSKGLACDLAAEGITVNCVQPGRIHSEQIDQRVHPTEQSRRDFIDRNIPAGRFGEPEDVAALVCFLASSRAQYITGATIPVDGGMSHAVF